MPEELLIGPCSLGLHLARVGCIIMAVQPIHPPREKAFTMQQKPAKITSKNGSAQENIFEPSNGFNSKARVLDELRRKVFLCDFPIPFPQDLILEVDNGSHVRRESLSISCVIITISYIFFVGPVFGKTPLHFQKLRAAGHKKMDGLQSLGMAWILKVNHPYLEDHPS